MNYYLFKTEQEAINALNYVNQVGLSLFPPERVTPEGIISINALTGLPEPDATKTVTWDTIKELKEVGWYFTVPTEEVAGFPIPSLQIPGEYKIVTEDDLYTLSFTVPTEEVAGFPIPSLQIPGEYKIVTEDDLYTLSFPSY